MAKSCGRAVSSLAVTWREAAAAVLALAVTGTLILPSSVDAAAPVSQARADFVSGTVLAHPLSDIVSVQPAKATNIGGTSEVQTNPLGVDALQAVDVSLGGAVNLLGNNHVLSLGAVGQYAQASPDGSSRAASGAVTDTGAIAVSGSDGPPATASLELAPLLQRADLQAVVSSGTLAIGALAATASQSATGDTSGSYRIASLTLDATSPAIADLTTNLRTALGALQPTVAALPAAIRALPAVGPLATITGLPVLTRVVDNLGTVTSADGSISADLQTGTLSIDVAAVLRKAGLDLNALAPNTDVLPYVTDALTTQLLPAVSDAVDGLTDDLTRGVDGISVSVLGVPIALAVLEPVLDPVVARVTAPVIAASRTLGDTVVSPLADTLGALLGLRANVQETGTTFREHALRLTVLPGAGTPATIDLASAAVGPNGGPVATPTATSLNPTHGPTAGGQTVTVSGTGFVAGATSVTIGGVTVPAGQVSVNSATSLAFTTPAHVAGDVTTTVTTDAGTSGPLDYIYDPTVVVPDAPTATSLSPTHGPALGGQTVMVTGTGFVPDATSVTIGGTTVATSKVTVASPRSLSFRTPAHAPGDVTVAVTTAAATSGPVDYTYEPTSLPTVSSSPATTQPANTQSAGTQPVISLAPAVSHVPDSGSAAQPVSTGRAGAASNGGLAFTGLAIASIAALATVLAMAGVMLQWGGRRRRY